MSTWKTVSLTFDPLKPVKPPLQGALVALHVVESILESILDLLRVFSLDFLNPLRALIALILAEIRKIINQIRSTGFAMLVVIPDFSRQDPGAILASVSGAYPGFERKLVGKFYDTSDVFRPDYPDGSAVGMVVFYVGADSPGDLLTQIFALLRFLNTTPKVTFKLPAPVNVKVKPVRKSDNALAIGASVAQDVFSDLFSADYDKSLNVEWSMPTAPSGGNAPGFVNAMVSFYNSFRFPKFVIERSKKPRGDSVFVKTDSATSGKSVDAAIAAYGLPTPVSKFELRDDDKTTVYRHFEKKIVVDFSTAGGALADVTGIASGTYQFVDNDPSMKEGDIYYYRVRAFMGETPSRWVSADLDTLADGHELTGLVKFADPGPRYINYSGDNKSVEVGKPSAVVKAVVPYKIQNDFNLYNNVFDAIMAAAVLNFELPPADPGDSPRLKDKKTGWGSISEIGGMIAPYKAGTSVDSSLKFQDSFLAKAAVRRLANQVAASLYKNPKTTSYLAKLWAQDAEGGGKTPAAVVNYVLGVSTGAPSVLASSMREGAGSANGLVITWAFPSYNLGDIAGGFGASTKGRINSYLALEDDYRDGTSRLPGPYPTFPHKISGEDISVSPNERRALAQFVGVCLAALGTSSSYLHWYSVTVGDLFPAFVPFIFDFEQFILALLKAVESFMKLIMAIIRTVIQKIQQLEQILEAILALLDLLNVSVRVSVLGYTNPNGSVGSLVEALTGSEDKPSDSPFGLHSGIVLTAGGPAAALQGFKALGLLMGITI